MMAAEFNPYKTLLKIDSASYPPDHYALLGIAQFESDVGAIEEGAEKRISFLQDLANSEHLDASQKLLNEVAAARRCLLNAHEKIAYDDSLRRQQEKLKVKRAKSRTGSKKSPTKNAGQKKSKSTANVMTLVLLAVVSVLALIVFLSSRTPEGQTNLVLDWPVNEREGATLMIDSEPVEIPGGQPARLLIPEGRRRLMIQRPGFRDIVQTVNFTASTTQMKLQWVAD